MQPFSTILIALLLGYLVQKKFTFSEQLPQLLNKYIIYFALPAMIFLEVPQIALTDILTIPVTISWSVMTSSALLVLFISWIFKFNENITGSLLLVSVLTNSTFLGIPLITAFYGSSSLSFIIVYDQLGSFLALSTYGTIIVALYAHKSKVNLVMIGLKIITFVPFIALCIALFLWPDDFVLPFTQLFVLLRDSIPVVALFAIGLQLQFRLPQDELLPFCVALFVKLIFAPLIAITVAWVMQYEGLAAQVSIMEAGMAPMITAAAMASMVGLAPRLSSAIAGYGILISLITTPLLYIIIH